MSPSQNLLSSTTTPLSSNQPPPSGRPAAGGRRRMVEVVAGIGLVAAWLVLGFLLGLGFVGVVLLGVLLLAAFQTLVRRRPLRTLLARDTAWFAHGWAGKLLVAAVLLVIPATMVLLSLVGGRYGRYEDDSWKALLMLVVLAGGYLASRRLVLTVLVGGGDRRGRVLGAVPEPGHRPQRRPHGPGPPGPAGRLGHAGRLPRRGGRRGRPGRGPSRCGWPESAPTTPLRWRSGR